MPLKRVKKLPPKVYVREWLFKLNRQPRDVAEKVEITESYMSEIRSGKKRPSHAVAAAIAAELGIGLDALQRPPPPDDAIAAMGRLDPAIQRQLYDGLRKQPKK
jgi:transcriptional regulator with XRE-family HTH domain